MYSNTEGGFSMQDIKTYLSVAPVLSALWFGALAGLLIEINRLFPDALSFPFFSSSYSYAKDRIFRDMTKNFPF
jgi:photosystem I subunit 9